MGRSALQQGNESDREIEELLWGSRYSSGRKERFPCGDREAVSPAPSPGNGAHHNGDGLATLIGQQTSG
jgi:hypothetical protein